MNKIKFIDKVYIGENGGKREYLFAPSWDCGWYWGFGYLGHEDLHHHVDSISTSKNLYDALTEYYGDSLVLKEDKLWTFCELMRTYYILKDTAEALGRGGAHYSTNPCEDIIKNGAEVKRINETVMPALFNEVYKLF